MNKNKKWIESAAVVLFSAALSVTAVFTGSTTEIKNVTEEQDTSAGVATVLAEYEKEALEGLEYTVSVQREEIEVVSASEEEAEGVSAVGEGTAVEVGEELSAEEAEWQNYLMADVNDAMNVRAEASEEAELVGKLQKGDLATILEDGPEWTKITSGNVTGYVKNEYCVFRSDAYAYAQENCSTIATVLTGGLRVRREPSTDAGVVKALAEGDTILVDTEAEETEGWVAVLYGSKTYYVSAEYVEVKLQTGTAMTMEEEAALKKAQEEARAAAASNQVASSGIVQGSSLAASADETTLLAAIIYCEAGNQSYEGQLAVGAVVLNRVKSSSYPNTIYDVIYQKYQFGPASSGALERALANGVPQTCYDAAAAALNGEDNTGGALGFKRASSGHAGVVIGAHVFY